MRITLTQQLENLTQALDNAEREADTTLLMSLHAAPASFDDLDSLGYELRRLQRLLARIVADSCQRTYDEAGCCTVTTR